MISKERGERVSGSRIDLHSHILAGLDDGARDMEESLAMARIAVESGVRVIAATPHTPEERFLENAAATVEAKTRELQYMLRQEGVPLRVFSGMEVFVTEDTPRYLKRGWQLPLAGTRYVLSEFRFSEDPDFISYMFREIRRAGFVPVAAHPERYYCVQDEPRLVAEWRREGVPIQLDKSSLLGGFGESDKLAAEWLLQNGAADLVASDAHSPHRRTTALAEAAEAVAALTSPQTAEDLFFKTPCRILCDLEFYGDRWEGD